MSQDTLPISTKFWLDMTAEDGINFVNFPLRSAVSGGINDKPSRISVASRADGVGCEY